MARKARSTRSASKKVPPAPPCPPPPPATRTTTTSAAVVVVVSPREKKIRKRALALLQHSTWNTCAPDEELPVLYAALKRIREIGASPSSSSSSSGDHEESDCDLTPFEQELIRNAALAVPYLMYKRAYEHFMLPVTMGGLALSDAKAKLLARDLFVTLGPSCCSDTMTDQQLMDQCHSASLKRVDARKILPFLKIVGQEAKSRVGEIYAQLEQDEEQEETTNNINNESVENNENSECTTTQEQKNTWHES